jgi:hypothetical protein
MEVNVIMKEHVRNITRSSAEVTTGAANRDGAAEGEKDYQAAHGLRAMKTARKASFALAKYKGSLSQK